MDQTASPGCGSWSVHQQKLALIWHAVKSKFPNEPQFTTYYA
jgi:hypothetical protein